MNTIFGEKLWTKKDKNDKIVEFQNSKNKNEKNGKKWITTKMIFFF